MRSTQILSILAARPFLSAAFTPVSSSQRISKHNVASLQRQRLSSTTTLYAGASMKEYVEKVLVDPKFPPEWPYSPEDFERQDESDDSIFYDQARLVYHIDDDCVSALTQYYSDNLNDGDDVLDICSSWVSHYPKDFKGGNVVGLGMNEYELSENKQLTSFDVKDLNKDPTFPYEDNSFDKVTCVVSVDYLNQPKEIFNEIGRVLRPGGEAIISMSNRCFPTKAFRSKY